MPKGPTGRPKTRREDDVLEDVKNMNVSNWKKVAQNRDILRFVRPCRPPAENENTRGCIHVQLTTMTS